MFQRFITRAALIALPFLALAGHQAQAAAYKFNSSGSFANCTGCTVATGSTTIGWGGSRLVNAWNYDGSTMTAVSLPTQSGNTLPASNVLIGQLSWYNASTPSESTPTTVSADYTLSLSFLQPNPGGTNSDSFHLTITNTLNNNQVCVWVIFCSNTGPVSDTTGLSNYAPSFAVDGLLVSNVSFSATNGSTFNSSTGVWTDPEENTGKLYIYATITAVPEPISMALLGTGLVGLGLVRQRRRAA